MLYLNILFCDNRWAEGTEIQFSDLDRSLESEACPLTELEHPQLKILNFYSFCYHNRKSHNTQKPQINYLTYSLHHLKFRIRIRPKETVTGQTGIWVVDHSKNARTPCLKYANFTKHKMKNLAWSTQILRKIYAKFTEITQNLRNLRKFTQNIFAFAHQNFEWSTSRVITEILPN